ncbi:MAG TPA: ATP-binding protein [Candidatus Binatia bacterium]
MRLRYAVPLLVLGVGVIVAALFLFIELRQTNDRAVRSAIQQLGVLSGIMVDDIERALRRGDRVNVRDTFDPVRATRTTRAAFVLDESDRVLYATDRASEGYELPRTSFASDTALVDSVRRSGRPQYQVSEDGSLLLWAHSFSMPPRSGELLPTRSGVLLVLYNLDIPRLESLRDALSRTGTALLMIALLCVLVTWIFHRSFTPRISALIRSTEKIADGDYQGVPHIAGDDELATIGRAISQMASALDREQRKLLKSEADLRKLNSELETRVRERTSEAIGYALDMEAFAFMISHDLRTPLRSIAGFAQVLAQDNAATIGQEGLENLGRVLLNAKRMNRLMDDILALSRHGRQPLQTTDVDMAMLGRSVATELLSDQKNPDRIHLRIDDMPPATADEGLLRQVIQNLLSNAIKYSAVRETAEIHFGCTRDSRGPVYFVADNGIGFAMKYANQVFAPFKRLHAPSEYEGTGVGLAIVKRVLDRHAGSIWVRSQFGAGTTFYFSFFRASEAIELARQGDTEAFRRVGEVLQ